MIYIIDSCSLLIMSYLSDAPKRITYEPYVKTFLVGMKIECSADGNPTPQFHWINNEGH